MAVTLPTGSAVVTSALGSVTSAVVPGFLLTAGTLIVDSFTRDRNNQGGVIDGLLSMLPERFGTPLRNGLNTVSGVINSITQPIENGINSLLGRVFGNTQTAAAAPAAAAPAAAPTAITPSTANAALAASNPNIVPSTGTPAPLAPQAGSAPQLQVS